MPPAAARQSARARRRLRSSAPAGRAGHDAHRAPPPALVEELHDAGRAFARDLQAGNVVADLDRQVELRFRLELTSREREPRIAEWQALEIERAHDPGGGAVGFSAQ